MAGVIKSKGNQVFTAQVRSVNTDTGSGYVTEALQRANARISDSIYRQSVSQQQRAGQEFARNQIITSIKDPDGNPVFIDAYDDLSQVALDTARPLIERKYASAFSRDVEEMLIAKRQESKNSTDFETLASVGLQGLLDAVPLEFEFAAKDSLENSGALSLLQHKQSMILTEMRQQRQADIEAQQSLINAGISSIATLVANGELSVATEIRRNILDQVKEGVKNGPLTDQFQKSAINQIDHSYYGSLLVKDAQQALKAGDRQTVVEMINALEGNTSFAIGDQGTFIHDTQDITFQETRKVIAADIRRTVNNFSGYLSDLADQKFTQDLVTNLQNNNNVFDEQRYKDAFGKFWQTIGISQDRKGWLSDQAVAMVQDQNGIPYKAIVNGNILPAALEDLLDGIANGNNYELTEKELQNALTIYQTVTQGVGLKGDLARNKGLSDEAVTFFDNLDVWTNTFGLDSILRGSGIYGGRSGKDRTQAIEDGVTTKLKGRNARQAITDHFREKDMLDDLPAGAVERLMVIAKPAYAYLLVKDADRILKNSINAIYVETNLIRNPGRIEVEGEVTRAEFAPERFYSDDASFGRFASFTTDKILNATGKTGYLGKDFFFEASTQSTNRRIRWFVLDAEGNYLPDPSNGGKPLMIDTQILNRTARMQSAFDEALERKLEEARDLRTLATKGMEAETAEALDEVKEGFRKGGIFDD